MLHDVFEDVYYSFLSIMKPIHELIINVFIYVTCPLWVLPYHIVKKVREKRD